MFVAASADCFPDLPLDAALGRLVDLEFSRVEIPIRESGVQLKPSQVAEQPEFALNVCRETHRLTPIAFNVEIEAEGNLYYEQFAAICKLAKAIRVAIITVPSSELGTPFNAEVERLRELVRIGSVEGVVVAIKTEAGCISQDPDTAVVLCDNVKGLGITLDPTHFITGPHQGGNFEQVMKYVAHVHLRDSSKTESQVRIGQGEIEYGRLVTQLSKVKYNRALCVHVQEMPGVDHMAELRKSRLLLESLV